jgi:hypothetical protein
MYYAILLAMQTIKEASEKNPFTRTRKVNMSSLLCITKKPVPEKV